MAKLALQIEALVVESFHPAPETTERGAVLAAEGSAASVYDPGCSTHETACPANSCIANSECCPSRDPTCLFTCQASCTCGASAYCYHTEVC